MTWYYQGEPVIDIPDDSVGFVYLIHDLTNDMLYVGKKLAITTKKLPPLKGKKNKRHKRVETDWRTYTGSNTQLNDMVSVWGIDSLHREILHWCPNKNTMGYLEAKEQFDRNVLLDDRYYNGIINCRINARGL